MTTKFKVYGDVEGEREIVQFEAKTPDEARAKFIKKFSGLTLKVNRVKLV